jgi:hypothetical protein
MNQANQSRRKLATYARFFLRCISNQAGDKHSKTATNGKWRIGMPVA